MSKEDYETAASHIGRYLNIGAFFRTSASVATFSESQFSISLLSTLLFATQGDKSILEETASNQLKMAENKLKEIVKQKLEQAIRADDKPSIIR